MICPSPPPFPKTVNFFAPPSPPIAGKKDPKYIYIWDHHPSAGRTHGQVWLIWSTDSSRAGGRRTKRWKRRWRRHSQGNDTQIRFESIRTSLGQNTTGDGPPIYRDKAGTSMNTLSYFFYFFLIKHCQMWFNDTESLRRGPEIVKVPLRRDIDLEYNMNDNDEMPIYLWYRYWGQQVTFLTITKNV